MDILAVFPEKIVILKKSPSLNDDDEVAYKNHEMTEFLSTASQLQWDQRQQVFAKKTGSVSFESQNILVEEGDNAAGDACQAQSLWSNIASNMNSYDRINGQVTGLENGSAAVGETPNYELKQKDVFFDLQ